MAGPKTGAIPIGGAPFVDLMPPSETARRESGVLVRRWIAAIVVALLVVAAAAAGAFWLQLTAAQRHVAEVLRTDALISELSGLSDVQAQLDLQSELGAFRADAMATDLRWSGVLDAIAGMLPPGVTITGFSLAPAGMPQGDDPSAEVGVAGTVSLSSAGPQQIVPLVRAVRELPAVIEVDGWQIEAAEDGYTYELRIALDQSVYTGAYREAEK